MVRAADAILLIETKTYGGHIAGSLHSFEWVQHLAAGETQHAFQNPVRQNHRHCRAVEASIMGLDVPVAGIVVSAGSATFCEALQGCVVPLCQLGEVFRPTPGRHHDPRHLDVAWQRLVATTAAMEPRREEHRNSVSERRDSAAGVG